ncbi:hypothetical protein M885DRAFT_523874 [Pelagophyceae sp. CCMP2097]|nr:hypothetical protein M885DRAFT_523874 [Pelagophyceae sp. CCMP2097]
MLVGGVAAADAADDAGGGLTEWAKLADRRSAVISLLRSVKQQLVKLHQPPMSRSDEAEGVTAAAQPKFAGSSAAEWGRAASPLSWRGHELARRLFDAFDEDGDGLWTFADFGCYLTAVGRPDEFEAHVLSSREVWRSYVHDLYGTCEGKMALENFVSYREAVELLYPIEVDALSAGLSATPLKLQEWRKCIVEFDTVDEDSALEANTEANGTAPLESFQLLCANIGEVLTLEEAALSLHWLGAKCRCMGELRKEFKRKHVFGFHQTSTVSGDFDHQLCKDGFIAWWLSGRVKPAVEAPMTRGALATILGLRGALARARLMLRNASAGVSSLVERGLVTAQGLLSLCKGNGGDHVAKVELQVAIGGDGGDLSVGDGGFGFEIELGEIDNFADHFAEFGLPATAASSVVIDLSTKPGATAADLAQLRAHVSELLKQHVEPDLRKTPHFQTLRVVKATVGTGGEAEVVIRLQFIWKAPEGTFDFFVLANFGVGTFDFFVLAKSMALPGISLLDLVPELIITGRCSHPLSELVSSAQLNTGEDVSLRLTAKATLARKALVLLGEELLWKEGEALQLRRADVAERVVAHANAKRRTLESHGALLKPGELPETGITGFEAEAKSQTEAAESESSYANRMWTLARWRLLRLLKSTKSTTLEWCVHSVRRFCHRSKQAIRRRGRAVLPQRTAAGAAAVDGPAVAALRT